MENEREGAAPSFRRLCRAARGGRARALPRAVIMTTNQFLGAAVTLSGAEATAATIAGGVGGGEQLTSERPETRL